MASRRKTIARLKRVVLWSGVFCAASVVYLALILAKVVPNFGFGTSMFGLFLGFAAATAYQCLRERGVWMLCVLVGVFIVGMAVLMTFGVAGDIARDRNHWPEGVDVVVSFVPMGASMWLLVRAGLLNWAWSRRGPSGAAPSAPPIPPLEPSPVPAPRMPPSPSLSAKAVPTRG